MKATCLIDTKLTKESKDSNLQLPDNIFEVSKRTVFSIRALSPQISSEGKRLVTFDKGLGFKGFNTWFLFPDHWDIDGVPRNDFIEATKPQAARESSPLIKNSIDWWDSRDNLISEFFTEHDVTNGDLRRVPVKGSALELKVMAMALELDAIRKDWDVPIGVTSWNRPYAVNLEVGGVSNSQHITGGAVDIYTLDNRDFEFEDFLDCHWGGGLGYGVASGRGFTHLDLREGGWRRGAGLIRWVY